MRGADALRGWTPRWWRGEGGVPGRLLDLALIPAEATFRAAVAARNGLYDSGAFPARRAPIPVISVGNLTVGGTGKTPVSAMIAGRLRGWGRRPAIAVRGYGSDEAAVHRELNLEVPVFAAVRRIDAVVAAAAEGRDCAVLDDGFQHRRLARDLDILLLAAEQWSEPRRMLPRGPWREPVQAVGRAGLILVTRKTAPAAVAAAVAAAVGHFNGSAPVAIVRIAPTGLIPLDYAEAALEPLGQLAGSSVLAVSSLADPRPFLDHLRVAGAAVDVLSFPDHHDFTASDIAAIDGRAGDRTIVVTRKEAVKLRGRLTAARKLVLEQEVILESGESELENALRQALGGGA